MSSQINLTAVFTKGDDDWYTAQIEEVPAAISQGKTIEEASDNLSDALFELIQSYADVSSDKPGPQTVKRPLKLTLA